MFLTNLVALQGGGWNSKTLPTNARMQVNFYSAYSAPTIMGYPQLWVIGFANRVTNNCY